MGIFIENYTDLDRINNIIDENLQEDQSESSETPEPEQETIDSSKSKLGIFRKNNPFSTQGKDYV